MHIDKDYAELLQLLNKYEGINNRNGFVKGGFQVPP